MGERPLGLGYYCLPVRVEAGGVPWHRVCRPVTRQTTRPDRQLLVPRAQRSIAGDGDLERLSVRPQGPHLAAVGGARHGEEQGVETTDKGGPVSAAAATTCGGGGGSRLATCTSGYPRAAARLCRYQSVGRIGFPRGGERLPSVPLRPWHRHHAASRCYLRTASSYLY